MKTWRLACLILFFVLSTSMAFKANMGSPKSKEKRVVGGYAVPISQYPWVVAITSKKGDEFFCTGSLIASNWVMTSAQCSVNPRGNVETHSNVTNIYYINSDNGIVSQIAELVLHPLWDPKTDDYDIALWRLAAPVSDVTPVTLDLNGMASAAGTQAAIVGWGYLDYYIYNELHYASVDVLSQTSCMNSYTKLTSNMICASASSGSNAVPCSEDVGGPLFVPGSPPVQIGIISTWRSCDTTYPAVYTRISAFASWINSVMAGPSYCNPNPCQNNGTCITRDNTYTCDCAGTGYSGQTCTIAPCQSSPCLVTYPQPVSFGNDLFIISSVLNIANIPGTISPTSAIRLLTTIDHPECSQITITLTSPSGQSVVVATGGRILSQNLYAGTSWEDDSPNLFSADYDDGIFVSPLAPLHNLTSGLAGSPFNGQWTLTLSETNSSYFGLLFEWGIALVGSYCSPNPCSNGGTCIQNFHGYTCQCTSNFGGTNCELAACTSLPCTSPADLNLEVGYYLNSVSYSMVLQGFSTSLVASTFEVTVYVAHPYSGDLFMVLVTPQGEELILSEFQGFDFSNVFDGASFSSTGVSLFNYYFSNSSIVFTFQPATSFSKIDGINPNGVWTLLVSDFITEDYGFLQQWSINLNGPSSPSTPTLANPTTSTGTYVAGTWTILNVLYSWLVSTQSNTDLFVSLFDQDVANIANLASSSVTITTLQSANNGITVSFIIVTSNPTQTSTALQTFASSSTNPTLPQLTNNLPSTALQTPGQPVQLDSSTATSQVENAQTGNSSSNPNVGAIVGGVIGGLVLLAILAVGGYFAYKRYRRGPMPRGSADDKDNIMLSI